MDLSPALIELGRRLRARRNEAGLTADELAAAAMLAPRALSLFEQGNGNLATAALLRVARVLGVPVGEFLSPSQSESKARLSPAVLLRTKGIASLTKHDEVKIAAALRRASAFTGLGEILRSENLTREFSPSPPPSVKPHDSGYALALRARTRLGREGPLRNLWRLIEERFNTMVVGHRFSNSAVEGAACRSGDARLIVLSDQLRYESRRRVVLAHELAHHLADLEEDDLKTDDWTADDGFTFENPPDEKRANAFALMLLAPVTLVRDLLGPPNKIYSGPAATDLLNRCRLTFGIGAEASGWHLYHLGYFASEDVVRATIKGDYEDAAGFEDIPRLDGLERRVQEALAKELISLGRARELLGISPHEDLPGMP